MKRRYYLYAAVGVLALTASLFKVDRPPENLFKASSIRKQLRAATTGDPTETAEIANPLGTSTHDTTNERALEYRRFHDLNRQILKTREQKKEWIDLFSNPKAIREAETILTENFGTVWSLQSEMDRLKAVVFYVDGLRATAEAVPAPLMESIHKILTRARIQSKMTTELKKSLLGDQIEILEALVRTDREQAERVLRESQDVIGLKVYKKIFKSLNIGAQS